jgi:CRP-like cAMP-binding protein
MQKTHLSMVYKEVVQLGTGSSFGELALINNKPRAATIKCLSDCHFAVISKNVYEKVLKKIEIKNQNQLVDFLKHLPFFAGWSRTALARLKYNLEQGEFVNG